MNPLSIEPLVLSPHREGHPHREACQQARHYRLVRAARADRRARRAVARAGREATRAARLIAATVR